MTIILNIKHDECDDVACNDNDDRADDDDDDDAHQAGIATSGIAAKKGEGASSARLTLTETLRSMLLADVHPQLGTISSRMTSWTA